MEAEVTPQGVNESAVSTASAATMTLTSLTLVLLLVQVTLHHRPIRSRTPHIFEDDG
jgi:hypothetical protein